MELACAKMKLAGQCAGEPLHSPGPGACGIALENHAIFGRAAIAENMSVPVCVIVRQTQQYRCRMGEARGPALISEFGWLIRNPLTFFETAPGYLACGRRSAVWRVFSFR
jgi:hypothetical protein